MQPTNVPHVLLLPFPAQGHIKPMMRLAELLSHADFEVTFVSTDHNHDHLLRNIDTTSFCNRFPKFHFRSIPDGLPSVRHSRLSAKDVFGSIKSVCKTGFRRLLTSLDEETGLGRRPTCIITDGIMSFATIDLAEELKIPVIAFRTYSASCTWAYFHISKLLEEGDIPIREDDMDKPITSIHEFENIFRGRDLPGICRVRTISDEYVLQFFLGETTTMTRASALILNTVKEIESPVISRLGNYFTKIYTIGPLHDLQKSRTEEHSSSASSNGTLREEDKSCMTWLDSQPSRSVLYVSFGSLVGLSRNQMFEFWHGIINSGKRFLWVIRSDLVLGESEIGPIPMELEQGTNQRGFIVSWAPQEEVLAHPAVGGFLTHSGWNSTLESLAAGVPMICWPQIADQQVNSRCVSEVWKIGFDMKDTCDRSTVEKLVRDLMDNRREEIMERTNEIASLVRDSVKEGGSSYRNLERLIEDIRSMVRII